MPDTMPSIQVVAPKAGALEVREAPVPTIKPDEVLIKVRAAAVCGSDLHLFQWDESIRGKLNRASDNFNHGVIAGHEFCGHVVEIGSEVGTIMDDPSVKLGVGDFVSAEGSFALRRDSGTLTLAGGAPLQAQQLAQQQALTTRRALFDIYRGVVEQRLSEAAAAEQWLRQDTELGLEWLLGWHMDLIRLNMSTEVDLSHPDLAQELRDLADVVSLSECFRRYHALLQIRQQLKMQRNAPMLMEAFFSTCQTVNQTIGVATG